MRSGRYKRNCTLASLGAVLVAVQPLSFAKAQCTGGGVSNNAVADNPEYVRGQPSVVQIDDGGTIKHLSYAKVGDLAIFEGDIVIGNANSIEFAAQAGPITLYRQTVTGSEITPFGYMARSVLSGSQRWTNKTVPYTIDASLAPPMVEDVRDAIRAWSGATTIRFVERNRQNSVSYPNYVVFKQGSNPLACLSYGVGMMGGSQTVELVDGCGFGQIVHEIGHVLGLDHEQNRSDRDKFVRINISNIIDGYAYAFEQRPSLYQDLGSYDFDSIMHYEPNAFTCNGSPTIEPLVALPAGVNFGQRTHISQGDIAAIKAAYK